MGVIDPASTTATTSRGAPQSPKQSNNAPSPSQENPPESKSDVSSKSEQPTNTETATTKPLAPPPRPGVQAPAQGNNTPDYFSSGLGGSLSLEPNPFEQSFGGAPPETPGGTKLPSVAALTSPSSLLPGSGATPFPWGAGSLRTGPLSPAMLSGPTNDYFSDSHSIARGFPTPNESSLRTGLTPGGSGSMFPAPSPNSQALFAQITNNGSATPGTLDFHRTALSAAAAKREQEKNQMPQSQAVTSQPQEMANGVNVKSEGKQGPGPFDPHDNDAANGLFMLAQGRNGVGAHQQGSYGVQPAPPQPKPQSQSQAHAHPNPSASVQQAASTSPQMRSSANGSSEASHGPPSDRGSSMESEHARPSARGRGRKNNGTSGATTNGRRKAEEPPAKAPASKRVKTNGAASLLEPEPEMSDDDDDDDDKPGKDGQPRAKMTDEEKRKNFLERNRVAALKCRQRKKQWLANLQSKVEIYSQENDQLSQQIAQLREEVVNLKTLLLAHKDCPVTQQQGLHGAFMQQPTMDQFNPQMNPYGMAAPIPAQTVMSGQPVNRRYS